MEAALWNQTIAACADILQYIFKGEKGRREKGEGRRGEGENGSTIYYSIAYMFIAKTPIFTCVRRRERRDREDKERQGGKRTTEVR